MAIIVDEEKNKVNILAILGWAAVIVIIAGTVYYLFFAVPQLVIISPPASFANVAPIAQITLKPEDVLNSAAFGLLKQPSFPLPTPQGPAPVGRPDPFVSP
jgi:hypothetical protein